MNFSNLFKFLLFIIIISSFPISSFANANFREIVQQVSKEAKQKGISSEVINEFKNKTKFIKRVIELDKSQPEFKLTLDQYLKRVVTPTRIKKANQKYKENKERYDESIYRNIESISTINKAIWKIHVKHTLDNTNAQKYIEKYTTTWTI